MLEGHHPSPSALAWVPKGGCFLLNLVAADCQQLHVSIASEPCLDLWVRSNTPALMPWLMCSRWLSWCHAPASVFVCRCLAYGHMEVYTACVVLIVCCMAGVRLPSCDLPHTTPSCGWNLYRVLLLFFEVYNACSDLSSSSSAVVLAL